MPVISCLFPSRTILSLARCTGDIRRLASFPTRRSSDLVGLKANGQGLQQPLTALHNRCGAVRGCWSPDRKSKRLNSRHLGNTFAAYSLKKKKGVTAITRAGGETTVNQVAIALHKSKRNL